MKLPRPTTLIIGAVVVAVVVLLGAAVFIDFATDPMNLHRRRTL